MHNFWCSCAKCIKSDAPNCEHWVPHKEDAPIDKNSFRNPGLGGRKHCDNGCGRWVTLHGNIRHKTCWFCQREKGE